MIIKYHSLNMISFSKNTSSQSQTTIRSSLKMNNTKSKSKHGSSKQKISLQLIVKFSLNNISVTFKRRHISFRMNQNISKINTINWSNNKEKIMMRCLNRKIESLKHLLNNFKQKLTSWIRQFTPSRKTYILWETQSKWLIQTSLRSNNWIYNWNLRRHNIGTLLKSFKMK